MNIKGERCHDAGPRSHEEGKSSRRAKGRHWPLIGDSASQEEERWRQWYIYRYTYRPGGWEKVSIEGGGEIIPRMESEGGERDAGEGVEGQAWIPGSHLLPFSLHSQYSSTSSGLNYLHLHNLNGLLKDLPHPAPTETSLPFIQPSFGGVPLNHKSMVHGNFWWASLCL